ncbi:LPXTG cell wall anchor domain-containing protein, partial [Staphylococcus simulans]|uniref:Ig-like domain-containing protein n=1 Tax=Staphylococcus simulans TaxID=1286 RepID=UPI001E341F9E
LKDGDTVNAVSIDKAGNTSKITTATVKDTVAPEAPCVNNVHTGDKTVSGTAEPGTTVTVTFKDGSTATAQVDQNGKWTVKVPSCVTLKAGDKVSAVAVDEAGNVSKTATAVVESNGEGVPTSKDGKVKPQEPKASNAKQAPSKPSEAKASNAKAKVSKQASGKAAQKSPEKAKALPKTGENTSNSGVLFGGLFAVLGSILLFRKRRNHDDNK